MKQVILKKGVATVEECPAPFAENGTILVEVRNSCISVGTEMSGLKNSSLPLWKKAIRQPDNVTKSLKMVKNKGLQKTWETINKKFERDKVSFEGGRASGYSASGVVLDVGKNVTEFSIGDRVACAGAGFASHAEIIRVPVNLSVHIPASLDFDKSSTVTLGAIALQGVRRLSPTIGETIVVLGLGILGQISAQILKANGCNVIGIDLDTERLDLAMRNGLDMVVYPDDPFPVQEIARMTNGHGADGVIIAAASASNAIVSSAFGMTRKKGRVVLVGDVGLDINREDIYTKELDFLVSTSYGPGRYDAKYEVEGLEYPISYVRWTENRNMQQYLKLVDDGKINLESLIDRSFDIDKAFDAYESLKKGNKPLIVLLNYPNECTQNKLTRKITTPKGSSQLKDKDQLNIALVGAGGYAKGMHLPTIQKLPKMFSLNAVMSRTGHNARSTAKQYGANYSTTDFEEIINDKDNDLLIIATRHNLHASYALEALRKGKNVLLEKPLCLNLGELAEIKKYFSDLEEKNSRSPILLTGFNRRFSPYLNKIKSAVLKRKSPMIINYTMNAGYIPLDHWVHGAEGGGRNIGEACHIYDLFTYLTDSEYVNVTAQTITSNTEYYSSSDNFTATVSFKDGSVANLSYTSMGSNEYPKEVMNVYYDGKSVVLTDYRKLEYFGSSDKPFKTEKMEKGQKEELEELHNGIITTGEWPIPLWQQFQATEISFLVEKIIKE